MRAHYRKRYRYVLVDEYQDTNHPQYEIVQQIGGAHRNVCVVGDDDQSIYGWRGADVQKILGFERDFPGAKVVRLETNYRSTRPILDAANAVIRNNAGAPREGAASPRAATASPCASCACEDETAEAQFVVREIAQPPAARGGEAADFAILCRTQVQFRPFEARAARERAAVRAGRRHVVLRPQGGARRRRLPEAGA